MIIEMSGKMLFTSSPEEDSLTTITVPFPFDSRGSYSNVIKGDIQAQIVETYIGRRDTRIIEQNIDRTMGNLG